MILFLVDFGALEVYILVYSLVRFSKWSCLSVINPVKISSIDLKLKIVAKDELFILLFQNVVLLYRNICFNNFCFENYSCTNVMTKILVFVAVMCLYHLDMDIYHVAVILKIVQINCVRTLYIFLFKCYYLKMLNERHTISCNWTFEHFSSTAD